MSGCFVPTQIYGEDDMKRPGPIRTALFVPGNRLDRVSKALASGADRVVVDLEDAVPLSGKAAARQEVADFLSRSADPRIIVRVNGLQTPYFEDDISRILAEHPFDLLIPKVQSEEDVHLADRFISRVEKRNSIETGAARILALIETATGVQEIFRIARTRTEPQRLLTVVFGAADYTADLGIGMTLDGTELLYPRSRLAVACRAAGLAAPVDTPFMLDLNDLKALERDARASRQLGFQGKLCIHPNQVGVVNRVFSPSAAQIEEAERIVRAFEASEAAGQGVLVVDGRFVDYPVVVRARRILQIAASIGTPER